MMMASLTLVDMRLGDLKAADLARLSLSLTQATAANVPPDLLSLKAEALICDADVKNIAARVDTSTSENADNVITSLELAMSRVYRLAVFIRGDYDTRNEDLEQKRALSKQTLDAFLWVQERAEYALNELTMSHAKVSLRCQFPTLRVLKNLVY